MPPIIPVRHDRGYTVSRHARTGQRVVADQARGREAHVFGDGVDLTELERQVWTQDVYQGVVGAGERATFDRFVWESPTPIGVRLQEGRPEIPLRWVEIKGKLVGGTWVYHLTPRARPAS